MNKKLRYGLPAMVAIVSVFGSLAYAEDSITATATPPVICPMDAKLCPDGTSVGRVGPNCEFATCPGEKKPRGEIKTGLQDIRGQKATDRQALKGQIVELKDQFNTDKTNFRATIQGLVENIKTNRDEQKATLIKDKADAKAKFEQDKTSFQANLAKLKDAKKQLSAENIVNGLSALNTKLTDELSAKVDQIENVLVSIESRTTKASDKGLDVTTVTAQITKAKTAIADARTAIKGQIAKTYITTSVDQATLKTEMKTLRDSFRTDMKAVFAKVKDAHTAVRTTATTLAGIANVDDVKPATKVEDNNNTTNQ